MDHRHVDRSPTRLPAILLADAAGIDFLNSVATPTSEPIDWIGDGEGLIAWLRQAGMVPEKELNEIVSRATPAELDRIAGEARALRDWFREFVLRRMGAPLSADLMAHLAPLNRLLAHDQSHLRIAFEDGGLLVLERTRRWDSVETLLLPIAEALAKVVVEEDFTHVKACQGQNCTLLFVDHTRTRGRRWCSMGVCGNRSKVGAHRSRKRAGQ